MLFPTFALITGFLQKISIDETTVVTIVPFLEHSRFCPNTYEYACGYL